MTETLQSNGDQDPFSVVAEWLDRFCADLERQGLTVERDGLAVTIYGRMPIGGSAAEVACRITRNGDQVGDAGLSE